MRIKSSFQVLILYLISSVMISCENKVIPIHTAPLIKNDTIKEYEFSDSILAQILVDRNFFYDTSHFFISHKKNIRLIAVGEGADYKINQFLIESYDNDGVEIYFDMKNEKFPYFNLNGDDRQYRILWNLLQIDGQNINIDGVEVGESDPMAQKYYMEIKFPWKSLGFINPKPGTSFGFDIAVLDNDGNTREALYSWYSNDSRSWNNTSYFGTLYLQDGKYLKNSSESANSYFTEQTPIIDGNIDRIWNNRECYYFKNTIVGKLTDESDLSGYFQTCWDYNNLYILVSVSDNIKSYASVMFDYGWIEDEDGNVMWKMEMKDTKHAGGGTKNRSIDTILNLEPGNYILHYETDESNSPANWDVEPPSVNLYGIKIFNISNED
ncbi:MAG TPA: sugar-binding protein [Bacteroidales bacterium]|nr:sugar-binding protein [Bacteroidales bacterium]